MYGPVRTVVWEGSGRETRPYPDPRVQRRPDAAPGEARPRQAERNPWKKDPLLSSRPGGAAEQDSVPTDARRAAAASLARLHMPSTHSQILLHVVFSTKHREPLIAPDIAEHYKKENFKAELLRLLRAHGVEFDERYVFD